MFNPDWEKFNNLQKQHLQTLEVGGYGVRRGVFSLYKNRKADHGRIIPHHEPETKTSTTPPLAADLGGGSLTAAAAALTLGGGSSPGVAVVDPTMGATWGRIQLRQQLLDKGMTVPANWKDHKHFTRSYVNSQLKKIPYKAKFLALGELPDKWDTLPIHTLKRLVEIIPLKLQMEAEELVVKADWKEDQGFKAHANAQLKKIPYKKRLVSLGELPVDWEGLNILALKKLVEISPLKLQMEAAGITVPTDWRKNGGFKKHAISQLKKKKK